MAFAAFFHQPADGQRTVSINKSGNPSRKVSRNTFRSMRFRSVYCDIVNLLWPCRLVCISYLLYTTIIWNDFHNYSIQILLHMLENHWHIRPPRTGFESTLVLLMTWASQIFCHSYKYQNTTIIKSSYHRFKSLRNLVVVVTESVLNVPMRPMACRWEEWNYICIYQVQSADHEVIGLLQVTNF